MQIGTVAILCITGSLLFMVSSCVKPDFSSENNGEESTISTRDGGDTPYYFYNHENKKVYLWLDTKHAFLSVKSPQLPEGIEDIVERSIRAEEFLADNTERRQYRGESRTNRYWTELSLNKELSEEEYLNMLSEIKQQNSNVILLPISQTNTARKSDYPTYSMYS